MNLTASTSNSSSQNPSKRMRTLNKWRRWRSPTPNTKKSCKSYTRRSYSSSRSSSKCSSKINFRCSRHRKGRSCTWQSSMRRRSTLCFKNLRRTCREFSRTTKRARGSPTSWRWIMRRSWLCRRRSRMKRYLKLIRSSQMRLISWKLLSTSWKMIWKLWSGRKKGLRKRNNYLRGRWRQRCKLLSSMSWPKSSKPIRYWSWRKLSEKFRKIWRRRRQSFTVRNRKLKICKRLSRCSLIGLRRWKHLWSQKSSRLSP